MIGKAILFIFPLVMAFAASSDLLTMRISNKLVLVLAGSFFVAAFAAGLPLQLIGIHVLCAAVVLAMTFTFFSLGWMGGGDAKLAAATVLWLGLGGTLPYLAYTAVLGGALTLLLLASRKIPLPAIAQEVVWIKRLHNAGTGIPYGIALAAAGMLVYSETLIFQVLSA